MREPDRGRSTATWPSGSAPRPASRATQKGDEVVTLNPDDTNGYEARFVLEAKTRKLTMRNTLKELDDAIDNRDALAAIAVFSDAGAGADLGAVPLRGQQGDRRARRRGTRRLRAAARATCGPAGSCAASCAARRRTSWTWTVSARSSTTLARAIDRCTQIRKYHTQARNGIDKAGAELDALVDEVRESLDAIGEELAAGDELDEE